MGKHTALCNILWLALFKECSSFLSFICFIAKTQTYEPEPFTSIMQTFSYLLKEFSLFTFNFIASVWLPAYRRWRSSIWMFSPVSQHVKFLFQPLILTSCCSVTSESLFTFFQGCYKCSFTLQGSQCHQITFYFYINTATIKHTHKLLLKMCL